VDRLAVNHRWPALLGLGLIICFPWLGAGASSDEISLKPAIPVHGLASKSLPLEDVLDELGTEDSIYLERSLDFQFDFPLSYHPRINFYLDYFTHHGRPVMERWLARSGRYEDMIRGRLRDEGLPEDFFYLALIESGFNPYARSRAGAGGIWQFMPYTGRRYGLEINYWVDERRDPVKSTDSAISYLQDLYARFGDWTLAAASYNAGEGKIQRAIKYSETEDYWEMIENSYLKLETRDYIPRMIAAAIIAKNPEAFGFNNIKKEKPLRTEAVVVPDATDLRVIARLCGCTYHELKILNPALLRWCTPPGERCEVNVPAGKAETFRVAYESLPARERVTFRRHIVHEGETLSVIAGKYRTSIYPIMQMNGIRNRHRIVAGKSIIIPVPLDRAPPVVRPTYARARPKRPAAKAQPSSAELKARGLVATSYVIREGDTLWDISQRAGVSTTQIKGWNHIRYHRSLKPGDKIALYLPQDNERKLLTRLNQTGTILYGPPSPGREITYTVRRGDNLWAIARRFRLRATDIMSWNQLESDAVIHPGDELRILLPKE